MIGKEIEGNIGTEHNIGTISEAEGKSTTTTTWPQGHPEEHDPKFTPGQLSSDLQKHVIGIHPEAVAAFPFVGENITPDGMRKVEDRTPTHRGPVVESKRTPLEMGVDRALDRGRVVIEVGPYSEPGDRLANRILDEDGWLRLDGQNMPGYGKRELIGHVVRNMGVDRVMLHNVAPDLVEIAESVGLQSRESVEAYEEYGGKTALNKALERFSSRYDNATLGAFGRNFQGLEEAWSEVIRLRSHGAEAYLKLDRFDASGPYLTSGIGQMLIDGQAPVDEARARMEQLFGQGGRSGIESAQGVVQLFVPENSILSLSTGRDPEDGGFVIYEAHTQRQVQKQDGNFAFDGAQPLANNEHSHRLLHETWPQLRQLLTDSGIPGDQNIDIMVIPPAFRDLGRELYGNDRLSDQVLIDLNLRPISGTRTAMSRFVEETGRAINLEKFVLGSVPVDSWYAANPHMIYVAAASLDLRAGPGGNFAATNIGGLTPEAVQRSYEAKEPLSFQAFIQDVEDPEAAMKQLAHRLQEPPRSNGRQLIHPKEAPDKDEHVYAEIVRKGVEEVVLGR